MDLPSQCKVIPKFIESDQHLKKVRYLQLNRSKLLCYYISCVITCGAMYLLCRWILNLKIKMMYDFVQDLNSATHLLLENWDNINEIVPKTRGTIWDDRFEETRAHTIFTNRHLNYVIYDDDGTCTAIEMPIWKPFDEIRQKHSAGINHDLASVLQSTYGSCLIDFEVPDYFALFLNEILHPFFIFQGFSVILWVVEQYYFYAGVIAFITLLSAVLNLKDIKTNLMKIRSMAFYVTYVDVYRRKKNGEEVKIAGMTSSELVPGDVITLTNEMKIPCDCVILQGQALLNECSLTGESIPVTKFAIGQNKEVYDPNFHKNFTVYEGTEVLQTNEEHGEVKALVIRTGFSSIRGQLIRAILYPKPHHFKFDREAYLFLLILAAFTLAGTCFTLPTIIGKVSAGAIALRILDLVTITVPPSLPAALTVGVSFALSRLRKKNIFCISPPRTVVAGRIDTVCFDKTGTITFDEMDLKGVRLSDGLNFKNFIERQSEAVLAEITSETLLNANRIMGTCHNVVLMHNHMVGDPMEVKLVHFSEFTYKAGGGGGEVLFAMQSASGNFNVLKKFEFNSNVQRMSVIASPENEPKHKFLFCKGAPEVLKNLSNSATLPSNFDATLNDYTINGYRVLGLAYRELDEAECNIPLDDLDRVVTETKLHFVGFAVFQNKSKPESKPTIQILNRAQISSKMSTGDNPITAASVAKEVSMISANANVFIYDLVERGEDSYLQVVNLISDSPEPEVLIPIPRMELTMKKSEMTKVQLQGLNATLAEFIKTLPKPSGNEIAFTGRAFGFLLSAREFTDNAEYAKKVLDSVFRSKIFARMQPNHKIKLIEILQKAGRLVAMVGDGANDVGALRAADVGLALSEAEASISAPFNSKILNISSLVEVLKEGRCTLATNFQCFKFMALYSIIQFTAVSILYTQLSNLNDWQFLWQDLFIIVPIFVTMSYTGPCDELSIDMPPDSLFSLTCFLSVFGQIIIQFLGQFVLLLILKQQDFFVPAELSRPPEEFNIESQENGSLFAYSSFLMIAIIIAFSIGKPFRKPWCTNIPFTIVIIVCTAVLALFFIIISISESLLGIPESLGEGFRIWVLIIGVITSVLMYFFETFVVNGVGISLERMKRLKQQQSAHLDVPFSMLVEHPSTSPAGSVVKNVEMTEVALA